MTDLVSVLLIIGSLTFGPYWATSADIENLRGLNAVVDLQLKPPVGADWRPRYWTLTEVVCRRVLQDAGVTWRLAIDGSVGWVRGPNNWLGQETSIEMRCAFAPDGYEPAGGGFPR